MPIPLAIRNAFQNRMNSIYASGQYKNYYEIEKDFINDYKAQYGVEIDRHVARNKYIIPILKDDVAAGKYPDPNFKKKLLEPTKYPIEAESIFK